MRHWWVNHKKTLRQEIEGGYVWAPKEEANRARSQYYENLRRAAPGDRVISYANLQVSYVGEVTDYAIDSGKPDEFGATGENWGASGWLLPVRWQRLILPIWPRKLPLGLADLLPKKYSPLRPETLTGNEKAYFAEISRSAFEFVMAGAEYAVDQLGSSAFPVVVNAEAERQRDEKRILERQGLGPTEKERLILARRGQGLFRASVTEINDGCWLTGLRNPALLVAGHIKPWRSCQSDDERLDGYNGLLLAPNVDRLFDRGLIAFRGDGKLLFSEVLPVPDRQLLGLGGIDRTVRPFAARHLPYLEYHRERVFLSERPPRRK